MNGLREGWREMATTLTIEVEIGLDVPADALGIWVSQMLNLCKHHVDDPARLAPHMEALDGYEGPVTVMWRDEPCPHNTAMGASILMNWMDSRPEGEA